MPEFPIPIEEGQKSSAEDSPMAQRITINWMVDTNGHVRPRPGISNATLDPGAYNKTSGSMTGIIGLYVWRNVIDQQYYAVYVRQDRTIWAKNLASNMVFALSNSSNTATLLQGSSTPVFSEDSLRLVIAGGGALQQWTGIGLSSRLATYTVGVNQPPTAATHVVSIGNYLVANNTFVGTANQIFWSNLGDANHTLWNPLNFNTADADQDAVVAIGGSLREVYAFGDKTVQVFGLTSDPDLPFQSSSALSVGCIAPYSIIRRDNDFAWMDNNRRFVISDGRGYKSISSDIDKLLRDISTVSDCFGFRLRIAFWDLLVWIFPTAQRAYVYDAEHEDWRQWRGWNGFDDYAGIRISSYGHHANGNMHIVGDPFYENLWTLDASVFSDSGPGLPVVCERVTGRLEYDTAQRKRCGRVRFFVKRGIQPNTASEPAYLDVAKRDDDAPWSSPMRVSLGQQGDPISYRDWFPGGIYRRRQYRIRYSSGVDVAINRVREFATIYPELGE